jgi:hypothetical protein
MLFINKALFSRNLTLTLDWDLGVLIIFYLTEFCWNLLRVYRSIRVPEGTSYILVLLRGNSSRVPVFFNRVVFSRYLTQHRLQS